jgi:hypothetical protein
LTSLALSQTYKEEFVVKFKTIKFKHYRRANELDRQIDAGVADDEDVIRFAVSMVQDWDFVDAETGEPLPVGEIDELTREQFNEVLTLFRRQFGTEGTVPKENAGS